MLHVLDATLEAFLREDVPLAESEIDVAFEAPDSDWGAGIAKPTVNLYLWDVRRNSEDSRSGWEVIEADDGRRERRQPLPRIDCRYLVTAWTTDIRDEHALLGQVLASVLTAGSIDRRHLAEPFADIEPRPSIRLAAQDASNKSEMWSALGGQLKPGLDLVVTLTAIESPTRAVGSPVHRYHIRTGRRHLPAEADTQLVGGYAAQAETVTTSSATAEVDDDGRFGIRAIDGEEVVTDDGRTEPVEEDGPVDFGD